ncbi:MAG TPA: transcription antitermination factor NusB [Acidobacteriota bacterium]|nr:transcription antitermination factor NusB [Acidobacteriota bacterium]
MGKRRKARESALQILFQLEFNAADPEDIIRGYWEHQKAADDVEEYATWLVRGIREGQEEVDGAIQAASEHWRIARMAVVDRNILRIAVFEMLRAKTLVPAIVINEAIEIAKRYSGEDASVFINGILDAARKTLGAGKRTPREAEAETDKEGTHGRTRRKAGPPGARDGQGS